MRKRNRKSKEQKSKFKERPSAPLIDPRVKREIAAIATGLFALVAALGLFGAAGPAGEFVNGALSAAFGITKFAVPFALMWVALRIAFPERIVPNRGAYFGTFLLVVSVGALANTVVAGSSEGMKYIEGLSRAGGYAGLLLGYPLVLLMGPWAGGAVMVAAIAIGFVMSFNVSLHHVAEQLFGMFHVRLPWPFGHKGASVPAVDAGVTPLFTRKEIAEQASTQMSTGSQQAQTSSPTNDEEVIMTASMTKPRVRARKVQIPIELFKISNEKGTSGDTKALETVIQQTLDEFGIGVTMHGSTSGPTVTQFRLEPNAGIKLNKITTLSNDLALALGRHPIRIEAPIPNQKLVGIEVPNTAVAVVSLRDVLDSDEFRSSKSKLTVCLGKDVAGKPWVLDIAKLPHMLVAGATGSGKSVCLNTIILSLLYSNGPDELKLMLIDPKRVELPAYNGIPHLVAPAVTEVPKIINALKWAIGEMDRRFSILADNGKRDITAYNESLKDGQERIPFLVIVVDELADLMMASASEVEAAIIRLAQLARAVGIHLIVATQRPSVDVITGLIKANITARVAFSVTSATDSRTILDQPGAEKLIGRGDSLLITSDLSMPKRIQGCFVSDSEITRVVQYLKDQMDFPMLDGYGDEVTGKKGSSGGQFGDAMGDDDDRYEEARAVVTQAGKASASYLQRRMRIGYARAASLLDLLEERGIIGPGEGAKPRQVLQGGVQDEDGVHFSDSDDVL